MFAALFLSLLLSLAFASPLPTSSNVFGLDLYLPKHQFSKRRPLPPLPDNDPWYGAPEDINSVAPGGIYKWRVAPRRLSLDNVYPLTSGPMYQIQYRTQTAAGTPIANVMTVITPENPKFDHVSLHIYFSDSPSPNFNPSLEMTLREGHPVIFSKQQLGPIVSALKEGWIAVVPDDNGPHASFPSGPTMAYATLDSLRAVLQSQDITGVQPDALITMNGYSGGGIAAAWLAELQGTYAPEVEIAGIALGGLVPDFSFLAQTIRRGEGYNAWGVITFVGLSHDYPELSTWLDDNLKPEFAEEFWSAETLSIQQITDKFIPIWTCDYFTRGCDAWDDQIVVDILYNSTTNGHNGTPRSPWYLYSSANDEISPIQQTRDLYDLHCRNGADILFEESPLPLTHAYQSAVNFVGAFQWLKERHARIPIQRGCSKVQLSTQSVIAGWPFTVLNPVFDTLVAQYDASLRPNAPDQPLPPGSGSAPRDPFSVVSTIIATINRVLFGGGISTGPAAEEAPPA